MYSEESQYSAKSFHDGRLLADLDVKSISAAIFASKTGILFVAVVNSLINDMKERPSGDHMLAIRSIFDLIHVGACSRYADRGGGHICSYDNVGCLRV